MDLYMTRCANIKSDGKQCLHNTSLSQLHCWQHNKHSNVNLQYGGYNKNMEIVQPKSEIHIYLKPRLIDCNNCFGVSTKNKKFDQLILKRINEDHTSVSHIFDYVDGITGIKSYSYDIKKNLIHLVLLTQASKNEFSNIKQALIDEIENGADTWMEGDISILTEEDAQKMNIPWPYEKDYSIELDLDIVKIKFE